MKMNKKIIRLKRFAKSICHCERSAAILLALALVLSLGIMALPMVGIVEAGYDSTSTGQLFFGGPEVNFTDAEGLDWSPLEVEVSYADDKAIFVIMAPVAFNPEAPNDNFWLVFDADKDGVEDFQVLYNTRLPSEDPSQIYGFHWAKKTYNGGWSDYQEVPSDWDVSATSGLDQFTVSIPVSYLGGAGSNYGFQIGLVKYVHETDWQDEWGDPSYDPICQGCSTVALIFVPLPVEGWETETVPAPKVTITKTGPATAKQGKDITYTITYKNEGTVSATNVKITETYPPEVEYVSADPEPNTGNNQWTIIGTLTPGQEGTITITVHIK